MSGHPRRGANHPHSLAGRGGAVCFAEGGSIRVPPALLLPAQRACPLPSSSRCAGSTLTLRRLSFFKLKAPAPSFYRTRSLATHPFPSARFRPFPKLCACTLTSAPTSGMLAATVARVRGPRPKKHPVPHHGQGCRADGAPLQLERGRHVDMGRVRHLRLKPSRGRRCRPRFAALLLAAIFRSRRRTIS
jgi:hypothetical protein